MKLIRARECDVETIWHMQREAFSELLRKYEDYDVNPANETLQCVKERLLKPDTYYYFMEDQGQMIGAIRIVDGKDGGFKRISPLFVMPVYRRRGYAQAAIEAAEAIHGKEGWNLGTIEQEAGNCRLYEKMGYSRTGEKRVISDRMTIIYYEK